MSRDCASLLIESNDNDPESQNSIYEELQKEHYAVYCLGAQIVPCHRA